MREIIFRGKRLDNGEWAEGFYISHLNACHYIIPFRTGGYEAMDNSFYVHKWFEVDPPTIGQYTGMKDKHGKRIFEGDIVHILGNQNVADWKSVNYNALIAFLDGGFCAIDGTIEEHAIRRYALARMDFDLEVIGNIHDNPELLKEEAQP